MGRIRFSPRCRNCKKGLSVNRTYKLARTAVCSDACMVELKAKIREGAADRVARFLDKQRKADSSVLDTIKTVATQPRPV